MSQVYDNMIDFLVNNSAQKFDTPIGHITGRQVLEKMWYKLTPEKNVTDRMFKMQRDMWANNRVKLMDMNDSYDVLIEINGSWSDCGLSIA